MNLTTRTLALTAITATAAMTMTMAVGPAATAPAPPSRQDMARARVDVCRQAMQEAVKQYTMGLNRFESVGEWSRRLNESERAAGRPKEQLVATLREHVATMKRFEDVTKRQAAAGMAAGRLDALGAHYLYLEAEEWLAEAEGR
jgi:hypothetical protein